MPKTGLLAGVLGAVVEPKHPEEGEYWKDFIERKKIKTHRDTIIRKAEENMIKQNETELRPEHFEGINFKPLLDPLGFVADGSEGQKRKEIIKSLKNVGVSGAMFRAAIPRVYEWKE